MGTSTCLHVFHSPPEISRTSTGDIMLLKANPKKVTQKPMTHEAACWEASQTTPGYSRKKGNPGRIRQMVKLLNPLKSVDKDAIWGILMIYIYTLYTYTYTYHGSKILCICSGSLTPKHLPNQRFYGIRQWWPMLILRSVCTLYIPVTKKVKIPNMFERASAS